MIKSVIWSQREKDKVIKMVAEGHTAREISAEIGRTRNSIIGFIHRSGLSFAATNPTHRPASKPVPRKRSKPLPKPAPEPEIFIQFNAVKLFEAKRLQCRYILDKPHNVWDTTCCGAPVYKLSYCKEHHSIVYYRPTPQPRTQVNVRAN